jgi:hypothetical protein
MTKKLEALFELPESEIITDAETEEKIEELITISPVLELTNLEKIENALSAVRGLEASDSEMDNLAAMAVESYKDLMDLGMNVEARFSSEIFGVADRMLSHAITAKNAKINKKLKTIDLQLKKAKLDQNSPHQEESVNSGPMFDRNELLDRLIKGTDEPITKD